LHQEISQDGDAARALGAARRDDGHARAAHAEFGQNSLHRVEVAHARAGRDHDRGQKADAQADADGLAHERMVRDFALAHQILATRNLIWEDCG